MTHPGTNSPDGSAIGGVLRIAISRLRTLTQFVSYRRGVCDLICTNRVELFQAAIGDVYA